nr:hypothetical protein [Tanacetum cinerariifolium]
MTRPHAAYQPPLTDGPVVVNDGLAVVNDGPPLATPSLTTTIDRRSPTLIADRHRRPLPLT